MPFSTFAQDQDSTEENVSTQESIEENNGAMIQNSEEDLRGIVEDYIKKDIELKGGFFIEEKSSGKILRLKYIGITKTNFSEDEDKTVTAQFASDGKIYSLIFSLSGTNWGSMEIVKINIAKVPESKSPIHQSDKVKKITIETVKNKGIETKERGIKER